jgi:hypothetical protein
MNIKTQINFKMKILLKILELKKTTVLRSMLSTRQFRKKDALYKRWIVCNQA